VAPLFLTPVLAGASLGAAASLTSPPRSPRLSPSPTAST